MVTALASRAGDRWMGLATSMLRFKVSWRRKAWRSIFLFLPERELVYTHRGLHC